MWYVIQVMGGQEKSSLNLMQRLVSSEVLQETFIPQRETMRHRGGAWVKTLEILFPGYLFVVTDDPERLAVQLRNVPAFTRLLGNGGVFLPLAEEEVALIKVLGGGATSLKCPRGLSKVMRCAFSGDRCVITMESSPR